MIPKGAKRLSDQIMRKIKRMIPKGAKRLSNQIMRNVNCMIPVRFSERLPPQAREA
jgi:hypothetical protein